MMKTSCSYKALSQMGGHSQFVPITILININSGCDKFTVKFLYFGDSLKESIRNKDHFFFSKIKIRPKRKRKELRDIENLHPPAVLPKKSSKYRAFDVLKLEAVIRLSNG